MAGYLADLLYMRLLFVGERSDFSPGDSFGELLVFLVIALPLALITGLVSVKLLLSTRRQKNLLEGRLH